MAMTALQDQILIRLDRARGILDAIPILDGYSQDEVLEALDGLRRQHYVLLSGPANRDGPFGMEVEELRLLPYAARYVRALR